MQRLFQRTKRLISICLVTLVLVTSTLLSFPAPAMAVGDVVGDVVMFKCESDCGNIAAFGAGVLSGSAVTLAATGSGGVVTAGITAGTTALASTAITAAAPLTAAAAPVLVPIAAVGAFAYGAYRLVEGYQNNQTQPSK
ncbi:MAG: hypothetical protein AB1861_18470 [Cyanobacteriota bacterium]